MATVNRSALEDKLAQSAAVVPGKILADVPQMGPKCFMCTSWHEMHGRWALP